METVHLRVATLGDAEAIATIYAPYVQNTSISFETQPPEAGEMARRMGEILAFYPAIVCEVDGKVQGYACAHAFGERACYKWSAESSVYITQNDRGKGLGRILYKALEALLAAQGVYNLYAIVTHPNPASEAFHLAQGYVQQGFFPNIGNKFGKWVGVTYYCKVLIPHVENPAPPIAFGELEQAEVQAIFAGAAK